MECYLCQSRENLSRYMVDGATIVYVCEDCEEELLLCNHLEIEDKIYDQPVFGGVERDPLSYACA